KPWKCPSASAPSPARAATTRCLRRNTETTCCSRRKRTAPSTPAASLWRTTDARGGDTKEDTHALRNSGRRLPRGGLPPRGGRTDDYGKGFHGLADSQHKNGDARRRPWQ